MIDMTDVNERAVLGYDLRIQPGSNIRILSKATKEQHFSDSVPEIWISADPTLLLRDDNVDRIIQEYAGTNVVSLWNPLGLANHLSDLTSECRARGVSTDDFLPVAVTCCEVNFIALVERDGPGWLDSRPAEKELVSSGWRLLGFDALDLRGLTSGLSGCGYTSSAKSAYNQLFGMALNKFGLFQSFSFAQRFAEVRGLEIPSHAPFVVVGVLALNT